LKAKGEPSDHASDFIWNNTIAPRVQVFMWLMIKGRIQCGENLFRKRVVGNPAYVTCGIVEETQEHIIFQCGLVAEF
jgi:hypothetical protein